MNHSEQFRQDNGQHLVLEELQRIELMKRKFKKSNMLAAWDWIAIRVLEQAKEIMDEEKRLGR